MKLNKGDVVKLYSLEELLNSGYWRMYRSILVATSSNKGCHIIIPKVMWDMLGTKMKFKGFDDKDHFQCYNSPWTYHTTMVKEIFGKYEVE